MKDRLSGSWATTYHCNSPSLSSRKEWIMLCRILNAPDCSSCVMPPSILTSADRTACASITAAVHRPWVILSAGVSYEEFACQLEIAAKAGASGYLAGRSLWRETASARSAEEFADAITLTRERIRKLNAITRAHATPFSPIITVDDALKRLEPTWYVAEKPHTAEA
ncbi:hypothetical protein [Arthrobacter sp. 4R501]|uniref:hypothetical protein n=1 Tax=Arthrobacter sp. 4R501 TaxID=2058886 RepID=UPI001CA5E42B|nr:hypothetical protein [Arthrobacter sp. 4R501]